MTASSLQYNPFAERSVQNPTTDLDTFIHLVKGALGAGVLAMPYAFQHIGLWSGIPGTIIIGSICGFCVHMLVKTSQTLCYRRRLPRLTYAETAKYAFQNDPKEFIRWGNFMSFIVNMFLVIDLMACVCIYLVNVGRNIQQIVDLHAPGNGITIRHWIIILSVPLIFLCLIRDLKYLVPFSMAADIFMIIGLIITFCFILTDLPKIDERPAIKPFKEWSSFFGISIFALEFIGIVLPCENEMENPHHFTGCPSVLAITMYFVISLYTVLGFVGYWKYGEEIEANITLNLPIKNSWCKAVKAMIAFSIYCTILLQYYVPINIILNGVRHIFPENFKKTCENLIRIISIIFCTLIAITFPNLGPFITFVGAICLSILGLILPAALNIMVFRYYRGFDFYIYIIKDLFIICFGIIGLITGIIGFAGELKIALYSFLK